MKTVVILERRDCKNVFYLAFSFLIIFFFFNEKNSSKYGIIYGSGQLVSRSFLFSGYHCNKLMP